MYTTDRGRHRCKHICFPKHLLHASCFHCALVPSDLSMYSPVLFLLNGFDCSQPSCFPNSLLLTLTSNSHIFSFMQVPGFLPLYANYCFHYHQERQKEGKTFTGILTFAQQIHNLLYLQFPSMIFQKNQKFISLICVKPHRIEGERNLAQSQMWCAESD